MRWLITGGAGQLGSHVADALRRDGAEVFAPARVELDITAPADVDAALADFRPDVVINAAAYTAVDAAEDDEAAAARVNQLAAGTLAEALARRRTGRLLHLSTDYVFSGVAGRPYDPGDPVDPRSAYGRTKLAGERAVLGALPGRVHVIRTAWLYGGPSPNFVDTMRRLEGERDTVNVVSDQVGSPTWAADLADGLVELGSGDGAPPVLHYANAGQASWYELAREVFRLVGADPDRVRAVDTSAFPRAAKRPAWSVLSTRAWTAAGLRAPRDWRVALAEALSRPR